MEIKMTDKGLEMVGRAADKAVWNTPRPQRGYWSKDYYEHPNADKREREFMVELGGIVMAAFKEAAEAESGSR